MVEILLRAYAGVARSGMVALVRKDFAEQFAAALIEGEGCTPIAGAGRGTLLTFTYPGGRGLIRHCQRGGAIRLLFRDRYFLVNRPLHEFDTHLTALSRGIRVPPLLGVCCRREGPFYSGAIATEALDAVHLLAYLQQGPPDKREMLHACGALIRQMHEAGLWHADLQVKNLLIARDGPILIDWDNARDEKRVSPLQRMRNLLRLRRSFEKNHLDAGDFRYLCEGYGVAALPGWLSAVYTVKGFVSDLMTGRKA